MKQLLKTLPLALSFFCLMITQHSSAQKKSEIVQMPVRLADPPKFRRKLQEFSWQLNTHCKRVPMRLSVLGKLKSAPKKLNEGIVIGISIQPIIKTKNKNL